MNTTTYTQPQSTREYNPTRPKYKNQWEQMRAAAEKLGFLKIIDMKAVLK